MRGDYQKDGDMTTKFIFGNEQLEGGWWWWWKLKSKFVLYSKIENYCLITLKNQNQARNTEKLVQKSYPSSIKFSLSRSFYFEKLKKKKALSFPLLSLSLLHKRS